MLRLTPNCVDRVGLASGDDCSATTARVVIPSITRSVVDAEPRFTSDESWESGESCGKIEELTLEMAFSSGVRFGTEVAMLVSNEESCASLMAASKVG